MSQSVKRTIPIFWKEFIHIVRDPGTLAMLLFFPAFLLVLFGYAVSFDVKHIPMAVLDQDKTAISREFVLGFTHSGYFDWQKTLTASSQFKDSLDSGKVKIVISVPKNFGQKITAGQKAEVQILVDGSDPTIASTAIGYINAISEAYYQNLTAIVLLTRVWYNPDLRSLNFYIPGLICVILMMMSASLTSLTIVTEREEGTIEGLVVSPVRKNELMLGKILPYVLIAFVDVLLVTAVGSLWFGVPIKGSLILLFVSSFIFLLGAMGIGLLISANAKTSQEAIQIALVATMLPSFLLSGFVFPIENMPLVLQGLTYFVPARYFLKILRGIFLKGVGLDYLWWDLLLLIGFGVIIIAAAGRRFNKRIE